MMETARKRPLPFRNPLAASVGQPFYGRKPGAKQVLDGLLDAMARCSHGTCWNPVETVNDAGKATEWNLMLKQCPGGCGHVWTLIMRDDDVTRWLVNEINQRRQQL